VFVDRFALPNHNMLILASSGAGKSYAAKALTGRSALQGDEVLIVDPDDEYVALTAALGGEVIRDPSRAPSGEARVICYALGQVDEKQLHLAVGQALESVWQRVDSGPERRRQVVVDEAYLMLRENPDAAQLLWALIKRSRKRTCGLTIITQDLSDVLSTSLGESIINNSSIHLLLRQTPHAVEGVGAAFGLSEGERQFLVAAPQGHGLLLVAGERAAIRVVTSAYEHPLCVSGAPALLAPVGRQAAAGEAGAGTAGPAPAYGSTAGPAPGYGGTAGAAPGYGGTAGAAPGYGGTAGAANGYGDGAVPAHGPGDPASSAP
jgi:hypothetical protein